MTAKSEARRAHFNEITAIAGFNAGNKGLFRYLNGRSPVLADFLAATKKSTIPEKYQLPMAIFLTDRFLNGSYPSNVCSCAYQDCPEEEVYVDYRRWKEILTEDIDKLEKWYDTVKEETRAKYYLAVILLNEEFSL